MSEAKCNQPKCSVIDLCKIIADQEEKIETLTKKLELQEFVKRACYDRIDAFEDFCTEAIKLDPSLEEIAKRNKVDTSEFK